MGINGENSEIVQTIAHTMDMNVTAEGVEQLLASAQM